MTHEESEYIQRKLSSYLNYERLAGSEPEDRAYLRTEMFFIRRSVLRLPESREKLFLYNRYIRGETMESCAELLGISRRSIFRLRHSALELYKKHNPSGEIVRVLS